MVSRLLLSSTRSRLSHLAHGTVRIRHTGQRRSAVVGVTIAPRFRRGAFEDVDRSVQIQAQHIAGLDPEFGRPDADNRRNVVFPRQDRGVAQPAANLGDDALEARERRQAQGRLEMAAEDEDSPD